MMIFRIMRSIALVAIFIALIFVLYKVFLAEMLFNEAIAYEGSYKWVKAEASFSGAIKANPFNSFYYTSFADFLMRKSSYKNNKSDAIAKAEGLYLKAASLNRYSAEPFLGLGRIALVRFSETKKPEMLDAAFRYFNTALEMDPNGIGVSYYIGYNSIPVLKYLNVVDRALVLDKLRYVLAAEPRYSQYVYPYLWKATKDPIALRDVTPIDKIDADKRSAAPLIEEVRNNYAATASALIGEKGWQSKAGSAPSWYRNGDMYRAGVIAAAIMLPQGKSAIVIKARGKPAYGVWPHMVVAIDGEEIGGVFVDSPEWKEYEFSVTSDGGAKVISVRFENDGVDAARKQDRDLFVGEARVKDV